MTGAAPLGYFLHSAGPATAPTVLLGWVFGGICVAVCVLVTLLLAAAMLRQRPTGETGISRDHRGLRWVYVGAAVSTFILFGMAVYGLKALEDVAAPPRTPTLTIAVTGYQWWWQATYDPADPARRFVTANEIHIPTGAPVMIELRSADVIHAFWAPLLAGKTQMIPGQVNRQWLQADKPGIYRGQCTQFCGVQHAHMAFEVVAQSPADFAAWAAAQRRPASPPGDAETQRGEKLFVTQCGACHAVDGTAANGLHAPNLTHLQSRRQIAAGLLDNTPANLADWIAQPQRLKPGAQMPGFDFSPADKRALMAYLMTLR